MQEDSVIMDSDILYNQIEDAIPTDDEGNPYTLGGDIYQEFDGTPLNPSSYRGTGGGGGGGGSVVPGPNTVGSEQIIDNSILEVDLNDSVKTKILGDLTDEEMEQWFED